MNKAHLTGDLLYFNEKGVFLILMESCKPNMKEYKMGRLIVKC